MFVFVPSFSGRGTRIHKPHILICGHSIVYWSHKRAGSSSFGTQLGIGDFVSVEWLGKRGMRWSQLLPLFDNLLSAGAQPQVVVVHLGENDLGNRSAVSLLSEILHDFRILREWIPGIKLVWSTMLPRRVWRGVYNPVRVDKARRWLNNVIGRSVLTGGGTVIPHHGIRFLLPQLFRPDGVHLSTHGTDLFLSDLQLGLRGLLENVGWVGS